MIKRLLGALFAVLVVLPAAQAQDVRPKPQIVGLPVFAADGIKIGRVSDVSMSEGRIDQILISTASTMGFGERIVTVPQPAFTIKGDMVLIPDLSAEDVAALPSDPSENQDARTKDRKAIIGPEPLQ
jgi:sporulation protein YlmC with PRC-barrel domain